MYEPHWRLPSALNLENLYPLQFHRLVIFMLLWSAEVLLVSPSSESFSLGCSAPDVSSFSILLYGSFIVIKFWLNCKKAYSTKSPYGSNFFFFLCLQHPGLLPLAVCFDTLVVNLITTRFHLLTNKIKAAHDNQIFLGIKVYLARNIERFVLLYDITLFLLKSLILFFFGGGGVRTLFVVILSQIII